MADEVQKFTMRRSEDDLGRAMTALFEKTDLNDLPAVDSALAEIIDDHGEEAIRIFLFFLVHVDVDPAEARKHWEGLKAHHNKHCERLGVALDIRVSALDYFLREAKLITNPTIMETDRFLRMHHDTMTDERTGLYNARAFSKLLEKELARADRYHTPLSLLFFDIDHFKSINDEYGHLAGDAALKVVADTIGKSVRNIDLACRYGGEEFAVIAPETTKQGAILLAERIRHAVEGAEIPCLQKNLTISGGVACFPEDGRTVQELTGLADQALYLAKDRGRNRIESVTDEHRGERRRAARKPMEIQARYALSANMRGHLMVRDVSSSGLKIESEIPFSMGSMIELELLTERKDKPVQCVGQVAHIRHDQPEHKYVFGVSIRTMSREDRSRFQRLISRPEAA